MAENKRGNNTAELLDVKQIVEALRDTDKQEFMQFCNYPTFALYLYNYCLYDGNAWQQLARKTDNIETLARLLEDSAKIIYPENHDPQNALYYDLVNYALNNVNWLQLAKMIIE